MSVTATVTSYVKFGGDQESDLIFTSGSLANSPAISELVNIIAGDTMRDVPSIEDFVVHGLMIIPPSGNIVETILKGDLADIGIRLSASQTSVIHFGAAVPSTIVLTAGDIIAGLRLVWF